MERIEAILDAACESQRGALRKYHETGSEADAARVHFESCPECYRALDALSAMRASRAVAPPPTGRYTLSDLAPLLFIGTILIGSFGVFGYFVIRMLSHEEAAAKSEAGRLERELRFVRMPGRPDICAAGIRGHRGYGPVFKGAVPCDDVRDRIDSDEDLAWHLRDYVVVRVRDTDTCLAHAPGQDDDFLLPCGSDD